MMDAQVGNATEQPLIVTCQTCHARLRVRSQDALGTIVPCPKCHSLVHVVTQAEVDSSAQSDEERPAANVSQPQPESSPPSHADHPPLPTTPRARLTIAITATVIVIGGATLLARWWYVSNMAHAENVPDGEQRQGDEIRPAHPGDGTDNDNNADTSKPSTNGTSLAPKQQNRSDGTSEPNLPPLPENTAADNGGKRDDANNMPADVPSVGLGGDDWEFSDVASGVGTQPLAVPVETEPIAVDSTADTQPIPERTLMYLRRSGKSTAPNDSTRIERALRFPIVGIAFSDKSLVDVLRMLGDVAGVPICLPPAALSAAEIDARYAVSLQLTDATLGQCLNHILDPLNLTTDLSASCVVVRHRNQQSTGTTWQPSEPGEAFRDSLSKPITFSFTTPTPLVDVLRHWESRSGVTMLVDWHAMAKGGLHPHTLVTAAAIEQPLEQIFHELLPMLELQFHAVDDQTIWITAASAKQKTTPAAGVSATQ